jgi:hypothetical protein
VKKPQREAGASPKDRAGLSSESTQRSDTTPAQNLPPATVVEVTIDLPRTAHAVTDDGHLYDRVRRVGDGLYLGTETGVRRDVLIADPDGLVREAYRLERERWALLRERLSPRTIDAIRGLGAAGRYATELADHCDDLGLVVHHNQRRHWCPELLDNPRHNAGRDCGSGPWRWGHPASVDHPVLLRERGGDRFAVLAQNYTTPQRRREMPAAPYGHRTVAVLYRTGEDLAMAGAAS